MGWFEERAGLDGTIAVVTGGAGGLGRAIAQDLADNGVRLAVIDNDADAVAGLRRSLTDQGHDPIVHLGDGRDPDALAALFAAVEQFARTLAVEVAPEGIRVNNVAPDYTPAENMRRLANGDTGLADPAGVRIGIPMGRAGDATDVSGCVVFLASDLSRYVTGSTLHPDGGTYASSGWFNWPGTGWGNNPPKAVVDALGDGGFGEET